MGLLLTTDRSRLAVAVTIALTTAFACSVEETPDSRFRNTPNDDVDAGTNSGSSSGGFPDGGLGNDPSGDGGGTPGVLEATIRDFKVFDPGSPSTTNPDFNNPPSDADRPAGAGSGYEGPWTEASATFFPNANYAIDIVLPTLGADGKPEYNTGASFKGTAGRTATTHGKASFDQWYHDTPGMNVVRKVPIVLTKGDNGVYSYDSAVSGIPLSPAKPQKNYFPIDDGTPTATTADGFGNQGADHNYSFTVELHTKFRYKGDETFKFSGDDDVFVFINKKLVINIGGIHEAAAKEVKLPDVAAAIGLVVGEEYPLDFFQAERFVEESNLRIETTIDLQRGVN